jgi:hypothetical protein
MSLCLSVYLHTCLSIRAPGLICGAPLPQILRLKSDVSKLMAIQDTLAYSTEVLRDLTAHQQAQHEATERAAAKQRTSDAVSDSTISPSKKAHGGHKVRRGAVGVLGLDCHWV